MAKPRRKRRKTIEMKHLIKDTGEKIEGNKELDERVQDQIEGIHKRLDKLANEGKDLDPEATERIREALHRDLDQLHEREQEIAREREELLREGNELLEDIEGSLDSIGRDKSKLEGLESSLKGKEVKQQVVQIVRTCEARRVVFQSLARDARRALEQ